MKKFESYYDVDSLESWLQDAKRIKEQPFLYNTLGVNKTLLMLFFNSSLRTRLSTQKAAMNLGMNVMVLDVNQGAWKLESQMGVVMDGDSAEHLLEAIPVMSSYCDVIAVRSFASLTNREDDYAEKILNQFIAYSGKPVISMESACRHPLQSFADVITIEQFKSKPRPKVVLTWAPHPRALPQAVPNSFAEWISNGDYEFVVAHPEGYQLCEDFTRGAIITHNQDEAFKDADFIYAKNWSPYEEANYGKVLSRDMSWMVDSRKMALTSNAYFMHCLPVRRNVIVTDQVIDSPGSIVIEQAANRVVSAQTVLYKILSLASC
ncbi:MAG: acetylornithine carbamoyltransferase [Rikenellaceae bacterium]